MKQWNLLMFSHLSFRYVFSHKNSNNFFSHDSQDEQDVAGEVFHFLFWLLRGLLGPFRSLIERFIGKDPLKGSYSFWVSNPVHPAKRVQYFVHYDYFTVFFSVVVSNCKYLHRKTRGKIWLIGHIYNSIG